MKNHNRMTTWHLAANYLLNNKKNKEEKDLLDRLVNMQDDVLDTWHYDEPHISELRKITEELESSVERKMFGEWYEVEFNIGENVYTEDFDDKVKAMEYYLYHSKDHKDRGYKLYKVEDGYRTEF